MEIDVVYSKTDPEQRLTRDFIVRFVKERGMLARIHEYAGDGVKSVMLVVDGIALKEKRQQPRPEDLTPYPTIEIIAQTLEQHAWG